MTLQEFIDKWLGKKCDFDGFYGGQCVDLYRMYVKEVLDFPQSPGVGGAAEIWDSADPDLYDFITNSPTAVPNYGDIVIWNRKAGGGFGHVDIFLSGDANTFLGLDQNWPTLSVVTKTQHNYTNVIGWLRPKKKADPLDPRIAELQKEIDDKNVQIGNLQGQANELVKQNADLSSKLGTSMGEIKALTGVVESKTQAIELLSREDVVQLETLKRAETKAEEYSEQFFSFLRTIREMLKLGGAVTDATEGVNETVGALQGLIDSKTKQMKFTDYSFILKIGGLLWHR